MKIKKALKAQGGFTLIEMLIVVAIIAILVAVSIPMVNANLEKSRNATDDANMRAAKAAAAIEYMDENTTLLNMESAESTEVYYDAVKGKVVKNNLATGYGKSKVKVGSESEAREGKVIKLTVKKDGTIEETWEAASN